MKTIVTHPANFNLLMSVMTSVAARDIDSLTGGIPYMPEFNLETSSRMERDKATGRFVLPDGNIVERDQMMTLCGTDSVDYFEELLSSGVIHEEIKPLVCILDDKGCMTQMDY